MNKLNKLNIEKLELDYTEASELFSTETLSAMQMAKVNGGNWQKILIELTKIMSEVLAQEAINALIEHYTLSDGTTISENEVSFEIKTQVATVILPNGTTIGKATINSDGSMVFEDLVTPTPN